jgi:hypothetical protein
MKRPGFFQGVVVAAVLGFAASTFIAVFTPFIGIGLVSRLAIPAMGLAYILYLFSRNEEKTGRITTLVLWSAMSLAAWWVGPPLPFYLLIHAGAVWLVRSLYFYSSVIPSLMDMGLTGLSIVTAIWALSRTGSVFLGTWCFFLVQALFAAIPQKLGIKSKAATAVANDTFDRARRQADAALEQLITR